MALSLQQYDPDCMYEAIHIPGITGSWQGYGQVDTKDGIIANGAYRMV